MDVLGPVLDELEKIWARINQVPVIRWGTITVTSPLRVMLDGDDDHLPYTPSTTVSGLTVGDRVVCVEQHRRVIILGVAN